MWIVAAVVVIGGAVGLALTVDPTDDATSGDAEPVIATSPAEPETTAPATTAPASDADTDATTAPGPSSLTAAIGDVFAFEDRDGVSWDVSITGLVEATPDEGAGGCLVAIGVLTPTATDGAVSSAFSTPTIGLQFGDEILDDSVNDCDTAAVETAGYGWILAAEVTIGTPYPFFTEFLVADPAERPDAIRAGDLFDDSAASLTPVVLADIPPAPRAVGALAEVARQPMGADAGSSTVYTDPDGVRWDISMTALAEVSSLDPDEGRCLLGLGVMTPTGVEGAISDPFTTPPFGLVVDGRLVNSTAVECDTDRAIATGYGWRLDAEVADGTAYPFYVEFLLPPDADPVDLLIVGLPSDPDAAFYEPTILDDIPVIG